MAAMPPWRIVYNLSMKFLYSPNNIIDANLLKGLLKQEGIDCRISGEYLQGGIGELPPFGIAQLLVDEADFEQASNVINAWESGDYAIQE